MTHPDDLTSIQDAIARLTPEGAWTQRAYARDASGAPVNELDYDATCFCILGALRYYGERGFLIAPDAVREACGGDAVRFNDAPGRTQAEILAAPRAAEAALLAPLA